MPYRPKGLSNEDLPGIVAPCLPPESPDLSNHGEIVKEFLASVRDHLAQRKPTPAGLSAQDLLQFEHDVFLLCDRLYEDRPSEAQTEQQRLQLPPVFAEVFEHVAYPQHVLRFVEDALGHISDDQGRRAVEAVATAWLVSCVKSRARLERDQWRAKLHRRVEELTPFREPTDDHLTKTLCVLTRHLAREDKHAVVGAASIYPIARLAVEATLPEMWSKREYILNQHLLSALASALPIDKVLPVVDLTHLELHEWCESKAKFQMATVNCVVQDAFDEGLPPVAEFGSGAPERSAFLLVAKAIGADMKLRVSREIAVRAIRASLGAYRSVVVDHAAKVMFEVAGSESSTRETGRTRYAARWAEGLSRCLCEISDKTTAQGIEAAGLAPWDEPELWMVHLQSYRWADADAHSLVRAILRERWQLLVSGGFGDSETCREEDMEVMLGRMIVPGNEALP